MLDGELAELYGISTKRFNEQVKRNLSRFPKDFMFQLTKTEYDSLRSQFATLKRDQHSKYLPYVFTEHGILMLSSVLNSEKAVQMNIQIMRIFVKIRQMAFGYEELKQKLNELERKINKQFSVYNFLFDEAFGSIKSLKKSLDSADYSENKIGFRDRGK